MKKTKIIVPALAVLLLSTAASVSGTVAWFSMNTSINVTGMTVTTKVSSSLQIAEHNDEAEYSNDDLPQARAGIIEPASTINGNDFYYTTNANGLGDANANQYQAYSEAASPAVDPTNTLSNAKKNAAGKGNYYDKNFNEAYGFAYNNADDSTDVAFAYIDYSFYLKANIIGDAQKIALSKCNLLYQGAALSTEWAWRVAVFSQAVSENTEVDDATVTGTASNLVSILDLAKSRNQNEITATKLAEDASTTGYYEDPQCTEDPTDDEADGATYYYQRSAEFGSPKAVSATTGEPVAIPKANLAANVATGVSGTVRYKVVVRLWLEGEDVSCTSETFATLTNSWTLGIAFALRSTDGITEMTSVAA